MNSLVFKILRGSVGRFIESTAKIESNLANDKFAYIRNLMQDESKGVLISGNHKSMLETAAIPLVVYDSTGKQIRVGAGNNLFSGVTKKIIDYTTTFTVNRDSKLAAVRGMRENMKKEIKNGKRVLIFPEGTRSRSGLINSYNPASFGIAIEANKEIPTYILPLDVTYEEVGDIKRLGLLDSNVKYKFKPTDLFRWKDYDSRVFVTFGDPISVSDFKDRNSLTNYAQAASEDLVKITASNLAATAYLRSNSIDDKDLKDSLDEVIDELKPHWNKFMTAGNFDEVFERSAVNPDSSRKEVNFYANQIRHYLEK
ncbi:MAG: lysophospholipid acyltransferase family protein [Candidatus Woesearchaeota archaeon]